MPVFYRSSAFSQRQEIATKIHILTVTVLTVVSMEHLAILLAHYYPKVLRWLDSRFQKSVVDLVPDLERLLADPMNQMKAEPVVIGPKKRFLSIAINTTLSMIPYGGLLWIPFFADRDRDRVPTEEIATYLFLLALGAFLFGAFFIWLHRGGTLTLQSDGAHFRWGKSEVVAAWDLFRVTQIPEWHDDGKRLVVPIDKYAILLCRQIDIATNESKMQIDSKAFRGWQTEGPPVTGAPYRSHEFLMADIYAAKPIEIVALLRTISDKFAESGK
jgi:hypothetical protein